MLSPDNYVQAAGNTQSYNRYSYCWNNPLKFTDPSGEIIFTLATLIAAPFTGGASLTLLPYAIAADLGGMMNLASNWNSMSGSTGQKIAQGFGYFGAGAANGVLSYAGGPWGAIAGNAIQEGANSALRKESMDEIILNTLGGGASGAIGYGVGKGVGKVASSGLTKLGVNNLYANKIISKGVGNVAGNMSSGLFQSLVVQEKSWDQAKKETFTFTNIAGSFVMGGVDGYFDARSTIRSQDIEIDEDIDWDYNKIDKTSNKTPNYKQTTTPAPQFSTPTNSNTNLTNGYYKAVSGIDGSVKWIWVPK
jgi:hypothetical protein